MKVGDKVKIIGGNVSVGQEGVISRAFPSDFSFNYDGQRTGTSRAWYVKFPDDHENSYYEYDLKLITILMDIKEKFVLAFLSEPDKSFRKAKITDGDNLLTEDGMKIFLTWLLSKNKETFKTEIVDGILKEQEEEYCKEKK